MRKMTVDQRFPIALVIGSAGAAVALAIQATTGTFSGEAGFVRVAGAGALLGGLALADGFGRPGWAGLIRSVLSFAGATVFGAMMAVVLLPLDQFLSDIDPFGPLRDAVSAAVVGPLFVLGSILEEAAVLAVWSVGAGAAHLLRRTL
ncbi:hypothetical protein BOO69_06330 [Sulfitobacter alexandrii]|uniref:Uncharacterized protein n=1 Tax=Sulfitobacter alexandrii TaxID=1917485 RepID=A0A1J0WFI7_9RHOB|nr:hypothetical protein [Sulfitobacter alexandrii]APE43075.1 hypothetical protein BOO69_06330 [Sulfitobacter alexandrii]